MNYIFLGKSMDKETAMTKFPLAQAVKKRSGLEITTSSFYHFPYLLLSGRLIQAVGHRIQDSAAGQRAAGNGIHID